MKERVAESSEIKYIRNPARTVCEKAKSTRRSKRKYLVTLHLRAPIWRISIKHQSKVIHRRSTKQ